MLKFFYRLKRRGGVVLFAVIAVMTLLIAMASVAYFTARSSYTTVIQNYDSSQLYLSATSVSDMLIQAITQDTSQAGAGKNYFTDLKAQIKALKDGGTSNIGKSITGVSVNKDASGNKTITVDTSDSNISILGANNPVEAGVLDAVKVSITLDDVVAGTGGENEYTFSIKTTAFYRENTVSIQDIIKNTSGSSGKWNPGPMFDTFWTATAQTLTSGATDRSTRAVMLDVDEVADNAYFQNDYTVFDSVGRTNWFKGGLRSTGTVFILGQAKTNIPAPSGDSRHDWIIGGDLLIHESSPLDIDLNGNNLYVKGDLYLGSFNNLKAGSIFVEGNIYLLQSNGSQAITINSKPNSQYVKKADGTNVVQWTLNDESGNPVTYEYTPGIYVGGSVFSNANPDTVKKTGLTIRQYAADGINYTTKENPTINEYFQGVLSYSIASSVATGGIQMSSGNLGTGNKTYGYTFYNGDGTTTSKSDYDSTTTFASVSVPLSYADPDSDSHDYVDKLKTMTVEGVLDKTGNLQNYDYSSYTAKEATYNNKVVLDFGGSGGGSGGTNGVDGSSMAATITGWAHKSSKGQNDWWVPVPNVGESLTEDFTDTDGFTVTWERAGEGLWRFVFYFPTSGETYTMYNKTAWQNDRVYTFPDPLNPGNVLSYDPNPSSGGGSGGGSDDTMEFDAPGGTTITVTKSGNTVTIDIPYYKDGYFIEMIHGEGVAYGGSINTVYNIHSCDDLYRDVLDESGNKIKLKDTDGNIIYESDGVTPKYKQESTAMPIVFAANFKKDDDNLDADGDPQLDENGYNAFSFGGEQWNNNGENVRVQIVGQNNDTTSGNGFVFIEMGNYDSDGHYQAYDATQAGSRISPTYYAKAKSVVGTYNQVNGYNGTAGIYSASEGIKQTNADNFVNGHEAKTGFENKVMLISNKNNNEVAYRGSNNGGGENILCGYLYAPNATMVMPGMNTGRPILGGMIVSDYNIEHATYLYLEPDPAIVDALNDAMSISKPKTSNLTSIDGTWTVDFGKNYLG